MDLALIAHAATLETRIPFLHFFDGFRTSHEVNKIEMLDDDDMRAMINMDRVIEHRQRALSPDHPVLRGTAQNPDVFFQMRETVNPFYDAAPAKVQAAMDKFAEIDWTPLSAFRLRRRSRCRARHRHDGLRRRSRARDRRLPQRARRKSRPAQSPPLSPVLREVVPEALPADRPQIAVLDRTKESGASASLSISTWSTRFTKESPENTPPRRLRPERTRSVARSSAAATACPPKNSLPPWSRPSTTISKSLSP